MNFLAFPLIESAYIEMKLALSETLKRKRIKKRISQIALAQMIASSQSRVAKMEASDPSVSIDLIVKTLFALGVSRKEVAQVIANAA